MDKNMNGTVLADKIKNQLKNWLQNYDMKPVLAVILVGDDPASIIYINMKRKAINFVGIQTQYVNFGDNATENELIQCINDLNNDRNVYGILLQLPLPKGLDKIKIIENISPKKDVDGLTSTNQGLLMVKKETGLISCTALGILHILESYNVNINGEHIVIVNNSSVIGRPLSQLLLNRGATVTVCHSKTRNLVEYTRKADILITAIGKPNFITSDMIKENIVIIDAGFCQQNGKICGDADYHGVINKVRLITPPVGGIGPLTIAFLLHNTLLAFQNQI
jgi:methylenetetrahydrofolate dehydrogenase (NADP+) / methenyltetrahydrofolate cyclohydrolase